MSYQARVLGSNFVSNIPRFHSASIDRVQTAYLLISSSSGENFRSEHGERMGKSGEVHHPLFVTRLRRANWHDTVYLTIIISRASNLLKLVSSQQDRAVASMTVHSYCHDRQGIIGAPASSQMCSQKRTHPIVATKGRQHKSYGPIFSVRILVFYVHLGSTS